MSDWHSADLGNLIPQPFTDLIDSTAAVSEAFSTALEPVRIALDAAQDFVVGAPVFDVLGLLDDALATLLDDFRQAGVYMLVTLGEGLEDVVRLKLEVPRRKAGTTGAFFDETMKALGSLNVETYKDPKFQDRIVGKFGENYAQQITVFDSSDPTRQVKVTEFPSTGGAIDRFRARIASSFYDIGDPNRPLFGSEDRPELPSDCAGIVIMVAAPTLADYQQIVLGVADLFYRVHEWTDFSKRLEHLVTKGWNNVKNRPDYPYSIPPDWSSVSFEKLFPDLYASIEQGVLPFVNALRAGANSEDALAYLLSTVSQKLEALQELTDKATELLAKTSALLGATGFHVFYATSDSGFTGWLDQFKAAPLPDDLKKLNTVDAFAGGMVLFAGGPSLLPFTAFFGAL